MGGLRARIALWYLVGCDDLNDTGWFARLMWKWAGAPMPEGWTPPEKPAPRTRKKAASPVFRTRRKVVILPDPEA